MLIGTGEMRPPYDVPLGTRRGTPIANEHRDEWSPVRLRAALEIDVNAHPGLRLRSVTAIYDCMGMVFAARRVWVDIDQLDLILMEDSYRRLPSLRETERGDLVVYRDARTNERSHVAIILQKDPNPAEATWDVTVMSKWGAHGEYVHAPDDVPPLLGQPAEYWTDRKDLP